MLIGPGIGATDPIRRTSPSPGGQLVRQHSHERHRALAIMATLPPERALFALTLAWTGARVSEVLALRINSFQIERYFRFAHSSADGPAFARCRPRPD